MCVSELYERTRTCRARTITLTGTNLWLEDMYVHVRRPYVGANQSHYLIESSLSIQYLLGDRQRALVVPRYLSTQTHNDITARTVLWECWHGGGVRATSGGHNVGFLEETQFCFFLDYGFPQTSRSFHSRTYIRGQQMRFILSVYVPYVSPDT